MLLPLAACGGGSAEPDASPTADARIDPLCVEAQEHGDIAWLEQFVFDRSCASRDCHANAADRAAGLNLEPGEVEQNTIGVPSAIFPELTLVVPGSPEASFLMVTLGAHEGPLTASGVMPPGAPLCDDKIAAIERWIVALPAN